jgi:CspA family cold shock protein
VYPRWQGSEGLSGAVTVQGVVQTYDPVTGTGIVVRDDDRSEVYLRPGSLQGSVFRTLRQGQRIIFEMTEDDGASFASGIRFGQDKY